jgi:hypothetical protein
MDVSSVRCRRYGEIVSDDAAALILEHVKVDGRSALVSAFSDRVVFVTSIGTRAIAMSEVARISHKVGIRTGRIGLTTVDGEQLVIRGLRAGDTSAAYQVLIRLASAAN